VRIGSKAAAVVAIAGFAVVFCGIDAQAQDRIALKNGESIELGPVYWVSNCRSIMLGLPEVEILEGPPGVSLSIKEGMVLPRRQSCANQVPGGKVVLTANDITEPVVAKLTYRVKYKTKDGDRLRGVVYVVSLFP
jgi:hypothetical protein